MATIYPVYGENKKNLWESEPIYCQISGEWLSWLPSRIKQGDEREPACIVSQGRSPSPPLLRPHIVDLSHDLLEPTNPVLYVRRSYHTEESDGLSSGKFGSLIYGGS